MDAETQKNLREVGDQLDNHLFPKIYNGGIVKPCDPIVISTDQGKETFHGKRHRKRGPSTRQGERATGWQRETDRLWEARRASPLILPELRKLYKNEAEELKIAYPGTRVWQQSDGMWLKVYSDLLPQLEKKATFIVAIPYVPTLTTRGWGFWMSTISSEWIGPRHTNFPDGSICAFEPQDKTWVIGDRLVKLIDLYTLWALRHLFLEINGRWPGYQSVHSPYERVLELKDDEFCGCSNSSSLYKNCCKESDLSRDKTEIATEFWSKFGIKRAPQKVIQNLVYDHSVIPPIQDVLKQQQQNPWI